MQFAVGATREQRASCSCWIHAWKGHCSHVYSVEEFLSLQTWVGTPAPTLQDVIGRASDEEAAPATPAKKRRRRRDKRLYQVSRRTKLMFCSVGPLQVIRLRPEMSEAAADPPDDLTRDKHRP